MLCAEVCKQGVHEFIWLCWCVLWKYGWRDVYGNRRIKHAEARGTQNWAKVKIHQHPKPSRHQSFSSFAALPGGTSQSFWVITIKDSISPSQDWPNLKNKGSSCGEWRHWQFSNSSAELRQSQEFSLLPSLLLAKKQWASPTTYPRSLWELSFPLWCF